MGDLLAALPQGGSSADVRNRERMLLDYAKQGQLYWTWSQIDYSENGHTLMLLVAADGIKLEGTRIDTSATLAQQIADLSNSMLPTPKICDIIYRNTSTKRIKPITQPITASLSAMIDQSAKLDAAIGEIDAGTPVADIGKDWVLVNALATGPRTGTVAANYGWHTDVTPWAGVHTDPAVTFPKQPGAYVIQSVGTAHDRFHSDYSQISRPISRQCALDGAPRDLAELLQSDDAWIASHESKLLVVRQPGVGNPGGGGGFVPSGPISSNSPSVGQQFTSAAVAATAVALVGAAARQFFG